MTTEERESEIDRLLDNWANAVRGSLAPPVMHHTFEPDDIGPATVLVEAAEQVEVIMTQCKRERDDLWRFARCHYIRRMTYYDGSKRLRVSLTKYKEIRIKLLSWVDGCLVRC